jgi:hypothetical protein
MQTFLHLLKWQIRQHAVLLLINLSLLVCILWAPLYFSSDFCLEMSQMLRYIFILCFGILLSKIVHSQPFAGSESYWMTRPIGRRQLLLAQLSCLTLFVFLPSLLMVCWNTYQLDGETTHYLGGLLRWATYLGMGLFLFSVAAASSTCTGAILMLVGACLASVLSVTVVQGSATQSAPSPDLWLIIMPILGLFATMTVVLLIHRVGRARICLAGLVLLIPFALNALRAFTFERSAEALLATAPKVELRMHPSPAMNPDLTSYMYPVQITTDSKRQVVEPDSVILKVNDALTLSANFRQIGDQISPYLIDKIIAAFPEADQIVSTQNPRAFINAPFLNSTWNQFADQKSEAVKEFTLDEAQPAHFRLSSFALYHLGPMAIVNGAHSRSDGHRITIQTVTRQQQDLSLEYTYLRHITAAMNASLEKQSSNRYVYVVLYNHVNHQVIIYGKRVQLGAHQTFSLATEGQNSSIRLPVNLLSEDIELHLFIAELEGKYTTIGEATPGTYTSERGQALK